MPTWLKIVLIVIGIFLLLGVIAIIGGVVWWNKGGGKEMIGGAIEAVQDGQKYGRTADNAACVDEGFVRYKKDTSLQNVITAKSFLTGCLQTSRETPNFCNSVPGQFEFQEGARWKADQCRERGLGSDQNCQQMFDAVIQHCQQKR